MPEQNKHQQAILQDEAKNVVLVWLAARMHQEWKAEKLKPAEFIKRFVGSQGANEMLFTPASTDGQPIQYINDVTFKAWEELKNKGIESHIRFPKGSRHHSLAIDLGQSNLHGKLKSLDAESLHEHESSRHHLDMALKGMKGTPPQR